MSIIFNGIFCETIDQLEQEMIAANISDYQKELLRNDFNKVENIKVESFAPVTNQQLRQAMIVKSFGENKPQLHPESIKNFILTLQEPTKSIALNYWEYSNEMFRQNPILSQLAPMIGLTESDLDNLWTYAKTLQ